MTVSINAHVGSNHAGKVLHQKQRWIPQSDDGSTFTPGRWERIGEPVEILPGSGFSGGLADGESFAVWHVAAESPEV